MRRLERLNNHWNSAMTSQSVLAPWAGESWVHKERGLVVTILPLKHNDPLDRVRWINQLGHQGQDTLDSFLDRFEKVPDLMAALEKSLHQ